MAFVQSFGGVIGAILLCFFTISCYSQQLSNVNSFGGSGSGGGADRAYSPDPGLIDFVYHNHDDMTRFLR